MHNPFPQPLLLLLLSLQFFIPLFSPTCILEHSLSHVIIRRPVFFVSSPRLFFSLRIHYYNKTEPASPHAPPPIPRPFVLYPSRYIILKMVASRQYNNLIGIEKSHLATAHNPHRKSCGKGGYLRPPLLAV